MSQKMPRREFIRVSAAGVGVGATLASGTMARPNQRVSPEDQVVLGCIGMGRQGIHNMRKFLEHPDVRVAAVCDVYEPHLEKAEAESSAQGYRDFRRILDRQDIDAVLISTPDHWHALMTVLACRAGKDVYVEKPVSVTVVEGRAMVNAAREHGRVVQVGTQQRSGKHFQLAVEIVQRGDLGKISAVRTWNFGNSSPEGIGNSPDSEPPKGLDWDMWLGPAPLVPFNANRFGVGPDRWSTFRWFWDYAGGMMTDWGVHLLDIVQWAMQVEGPVSAVAHGGNWVLDDNREAPDTLLVSLQYPASGSNPPFLCTYENRNGNGREISGHGYGIEFYGSEGTLFIDRSGFEILPEHFRRNDKEVPRLYRMEQENTNDHNHDHVRNFLDCIKSRGKPVSDIEVGHTSTASCLLGNIAYRTARSLDWDPKTESIWDNPKASALLHREYRAPWKL